MFRKYKSFFLGFLTAAFLFSGVVAMAASVDVEIKAKLMGSIKMKLYNEDFKPKDKSGTYYKPISYKGQLYLPVTCLEKGLGIPMEWEKTSKTLWIGGKTDNLPVNDTKEYQDYYGTMITTDIARLTTPTDTYKWGICNSQVLELAYFQCFLKPEGKYKKFTSSIYLDDQVKQVLTLEFRKETDKGEVLKSLELKPGQTAEVELAISGIKKICVVANIRMEHDKVTKLIIGEPTFTNDSK